MNLLIHPVDAWIIGVYLVLTVAMGIWIGRGNSSARNYFLGDRKLPWWAMLFSIVASETSTVTFLSVPGLDFKENGNFYFLQLALGFVIGRIAVAWLILPRYFRGELQTSYQLLETVTGAGARRLSSGLFLATRTIGDALRLFLTALVLYNVIQLGLPLCILIVGVATIIYTFAGGLKAVVWNDVIQFVVYILGAFWALTVLIHAVGGWQVLFEFGQSTGRLNLVDWNPFSEGTNFWVGLIGGGFLSFATHGTDHMVVQRLLGSRDLPSARRAIVLSGVVVFLQFSLFLVIGLALACFYAQAKTAPSFQSNDEVFVTFISTELQTGVVGLILAAVFAAAMSTQSSSLNSMASAFVSDFWGTFRPRATDHQRLLAGKMMTVVFGILQMSVALLAYFFLMEERSTVNLVFELAAFAYGPVLGLFFLAIFLRQRLSSQSSCLAFAIGLIVIVTIKVLSLESIAVIQVPGLWFTPIGSITTLAFGWLLSRFDFSSKE